MSRSSTPETQIWKPESPDSLTVQPIHRTLSSDTQLPSRDWEPKKRASIESFLSTGTFSIDDGVAVDSPSKPGWSERMAQKHKKELPVKHTPAPQSQNESFYLDDDTASDTSSEGAHSIPPSHFPLQLPRQSMDSTTTTESFAIEPKEKPQWGIESGWEFLPANTPLPPGPKESIKSLQSIQPTRTLQSVQPARTPQPVQPARIFQPDQPTRKSESVQPIQPPQSIQPLQPSQSIEPLQPPQSIQPLQPSQSIEPLQPPQSIQPTQPPQSIQPIQPPQSTQPVSRSIQPIQPIPPSQSIQPIPSIQLVQPQPISDPLPNTLEKSARNFSRPFRPAVDRSPQNTEPSYAHIYTTHLFRGPAKRLSSIISVGSYAGSSASSINGSIRESPNAVDPDPLLQASISRTNSSSSDPKSDRSISIHSSTEQTPASPLTQLPNLSLQQTSSSNSSRSSILNAQQRAPAPPQHPGMPKKHVSFENRTQQTLLTPLTTQQQQQQDQITPLLTPTLLTPNPPTSTSTPTSSSASSTRTTTNRSGSGSASVRTATSTSTTSTELSRPVSNFDTSALTPKELAKLRKKGIDPALYLEMKAATGADRKKRTLVGNMFIG